MPCMVSSSKKNWTRHYLCWGCVFEDTPLLFEQPPLADEDGAERVEAQKD